MRRTILLTDVRKSLPLQQQGTKAKPTKTQRKRYCAFWCIPSQPETVPIGLQLRGTCVCVWVAEEGLAECPHP